MGSGVFGRPHRHLTTVDSTNLAALQWAAEGAPHGAIVTAEGQSAGRGRRGRAWSSPPGRGLYASLILRPALQLEVSLLSLAAGVAAVEALRHLTGLQPSTKWPNDILLNEKKVGGILVEVAGPVAVVGLGVNVGHRPEDLPPRSIFPASSLLLECGHLWPVEEIAAAWLHQMEHFFALAGHDVPGLLGAYSRVCGGWGRSVTVQQGDEVWQGRAVGLDECGRLLVEAPEGQRTVLSGDVTW